MAKFATDASRAIWWLKLLPIQVIVQWIHGPRQLSLKLKLSKKDTNSIRLNVAETQPHHRGPTRSRVAEKAGLVAYLRRSLSITCVREQARLLLGRLRLLGDGAAEAGRRRARAEQLEAAALRERQAQSVAFLQGRSLRRLGFGRLEI